MLCLVLKSELRPEMANWQEESELTTLKPSSEGAGIPRPLCFRMDPEICPRQRPLRPEAHQVAGLAKRSPEDTEGRRKMRWWPLHFGGEESSLACFRKNNNNGPQIRFILWRLRLSALPVSPLFRWVFIWVRRGRSFWNAAACLADSWNLLTTDLSVSPKNPEGK